ncbi:nitroreductase family deazaflavin-dependent oxidoreductase [Kribbella jejuensis]
MPSAEGWVREQVDKVTEAGTTDAVSIQGMKVVLLTMRGAKSGKIRKVPVMRVEHDGKYAAFASLGGAPKHPVWYYNLQADPKVTLQDGETVGEYVAREVDGAEYDEWWARGVDAYPPYAEYQTKTTRKIPVFVLEPTN